VPSAPDHKWSGRRGDRRSFPASQVSCRGDFSGNRQRGGRGAGEDMVAMKCLRCRRRVAVQSSFRPGQARRRASQQAGTTCTQTKPVITPDFYQTRLTPTPVCSCRFAAEVCNFRTLSEKQNSVGLQCRVRRCLRASRCRLTRRRGTPARRSLLAHDGQECPSSGQSDDQSDVFKQTRIVIRARASSATQLHPGNAHESFVDIFGSDRADRHGQPGRFRHLVFGQPGDLWKRDIGGGSSVA